MTVLVTGSAAACPPATVESTRRALLRAGETAPFGLSCPPGRVVLRLEVEPPLELELSAEDAAAPWTGTALARLVEAHRAVSATVPVDAPAKETGVAPTPEWLVSMADGMVTRDTSSLMATGDAPVVAVVVRALTKRGVQGPWTTALELAMRHGHWEQGLAMEAAWTSVAQGVLRGQSLGWTVARPMTPAHRGAVVFDWAPRVEAGVVRLAGAAHGGVAAAPVTLAAQAEASLEGAVHVPVSRLTRLMAGVRAGGRAGPVGTVDGRTALSWQGLFIGLWVGVSGGGR